MFTTRTARLIHGLRRDEDETKGWPDRQNGTLLGHNAAGAHLPVCPCGHLHIGTKCRCVGTVPPQALLAEEIEGVLCTAGMKAG